MPIKKRNFTEESPSESCRFLLQDLIFVEDCINTAIIHEVIGNEIEKGV